MPAASTASRPPPPPPPPPADAAAPGLQLGGNGPVGADADVLGVAPFVVHGLLPIYYMYVVSLQQNNNNKKPGPGPATTGMGITGCLSVARRRGVVVRPSFVYLLKTRAECRAEQSQSARGCKKVVQSKLCKVQRCKSKRRTKKVVVGNHGKRQGQGKARRTPRRTGLCRAERR